MENDGKLQIQGKTYGKSLNQSSDSAKHGKQRQDYGEQLHRTIAKRLQSLLSYFWLPLALIISGAGSFGQVCSWEVHLTRIYTLLKYSSFHFLFHYPYIAPMYPTVGIENKTAWIIQWE